MFKQQTYKDSKTFSERKIDYNRLKAKYPLHVPVIIDKSEIKLKKYKFLIDNDMQMSHLIYAIRKQTELGPHEAMFIYVKNSLVQTNQIIYNIWEEYHEDDGFLYLTVSKENTFG